MGMNRREVRLNSKFRTTLILVIWTLWLTGMLLFIFPVSITDFNSLAAKLSPSLLAAHGSLAYLFLILFGYLLAEHIPTGLLGVKNKKSGIGLISFITLLTISGLALYYSGGEWMRDKVVLVHTFVGVVFPLLFVWHYRGRTKARLARKALSP